MKKLIVFAILILGSVSCTAVSQIEGFLYLKASPKEISKLSGLPRDTFSKSVFWQYPIGNFTTSKSCKQVALQLLSNIPSRNTDGWMCGINCKIDADLNIKVCTAVAGD